MKKYLSLAIAATVIGFIAFALLYWLFAWSYDHSLLLGFVIAISGFVMEIIRPYIFKMFSRQKE